jgi:hypothetical protein
MDSICSMILLSIRLETLTLRTASQVSFSGFRRGKEQVEEMSAAFFYPNGIAIDDSGENLYVADYHWSLPVFIILTNTFSKVDDNGVTFLQGIDGLVFYKSSLIALQDTGNKDDRVVRFHLDQSRSAIKKSRSLAVLPG